MNWPLLRDQFLSEHATLAKRWETAKSQMFSAGMSDDDACDAADEIVGIGPEAERVIKWQAKSGWTPVEPDTQTAEPDGKGATDVRNVRWVAENLTNPLATAESAPSLSAWNMLVFARGSAQNTAKFYSDLYRPIMLPAKKDLENTSRDLEDEERLMNIIEQVRKMIPAS